ncbi:type VII secretion protein EssB [Gracilibacillus kekensis]|uniref:Type VII secretion protein EssB n=1 Tax=Gracilibacillus kekensis TaxID=1027249 RepID=A0A1M7JQM8_9BACI|nr:type VII secretion protein EssB [Gracilibacillus kekensis]SHM55023.1 type VII secretion protein EssB [Gracilibacillus kekensis]
MTEKKIELDHLSLPFQVYEDRWELRLAKSQTRVKDPQQIRLLTGADTNAFVPLEVKEEEDAFTFSFFIDPEKKNWQAIQHLHRNDKLRLLLNLARLRHYLKSRITFFLHPDNLLFDDNLSPHVVYRGVRNLIPPYEMEEQEFLKQLKCFSIALLSKKYTYEQLYNGALEHAKDTEFERQVHQKETLAAFADYLQDCYQKEQKKTERTMKLFPIKRFLLFKRLAISFIIVSVLLAIPLIYFGLISLPYHQSQLDAHEEYLASNYNGVITTLNGEDAEDLPKATKYILAYSYVTSEKISDNDKEVIMNNITLNSDENYLLYWIYNGRGNFEPAMDKAKYLDDPQLIMYGLIKQIEQARNDPGLSGSEREEQVNNLNEELQEYIDELPDEEEDQFDSESQEETAIPGNDSEPEDQTQAETDATLEE